MASYHDGMGSAKSTITLEPSAATSNNSIARSSPFENPDEKKTADAQPPKGQGSDITQFATSQITDNLVLHILTDRVAELEGESDYALTTVTAELKSEVGRIETRLTEF